MTPKPRRTSTGNGNRRGENYGIRDRPGCKPAVEVRLPGPLKGKIWIRVDDQESAKKLRELICRYTDGIEAFPLDHPDLPRLQEFSKKEFQAFVLTEFKRRFPSINQGRGSTDHLHQEHGIFQPIAGESLADSADGFDDGKMVESMMATDAPESSSAHLEVNKNSENLLPSGREASFLGVTIPEELRNPSTHFQAPASTDHLHQGLAINQPPTTQLLESAVENLSSSDLKFTSEGGNSLPYGEQNLGTRNEGVGGSSENEARCTEFFVAQQFPTEPSNCRYDLTHGSNQREIGESRMPTNGAQSIFAEFEVIKSLQNVSPPGSEALSSDQALSLQDVLARIQFALEQISERIQVKHENRHCEDELTRQGRQREDEMTRQRRQRDDEMFHQLLMPCLQQVSGSVDTILGVCATEGSTTNTCKQVTCKKLFWLQWSSRFVLLVVR